MITKEDICELDNINQREWVDGKISDDVYSSTRDFLHYLWIYYTDEGKQLEKLLSRFND